MITRDDAHSYAMTFSNVYIDVPFRDTNYHRVVDSKAKLADEFAFGGIGVQAKLLMDEGVEVIDNSVNLEKYQMCFK